MALLDSSQESDISDYHLAPKENPRPEGLCPGSSQSHQGALKSSSAQTATGTRDGDCSSVGTTAQADLYAFPPTLSPLVFLSRAFRGVLFTAWMQ